MCYCDTIEPDAYSLEQRKARKRHTCGECGTNIQPGEEYEYVSGVWEGSPNSFKTCAACVAFRQWLVAKLDCFCWSHGGLWDDVDGAIDGMDPGPLKFGAYRRFILMQRRNRKVSVPPLSELAGEREEV